MTKLVVILIVLVLFIVGFAGWTYAVTNRIALSRKVADSTAQNLAWNAAQNKMQSTATAREAGWMTTQSLLQTQFEATASAQQGLLLKATDVLSTVTQSASEQSTLVAGLRQFSATQFLEMEDLKNTSKCLLKPNSIDYTSNSTVSASLKQWLETTREDISKADWDVLWSNSETAIHYLEGEYFYVFAVYFDEPDNYFSPSVYDVFGHCWLEQ